MSTGEIMQPLCPSGYHFVKEKCKCVKDSPTPHECPPDYHWSESQQQCVPDLKPMFKKCAHGYHWDYVQHTCVLDTVPHECPPGYHWSSAENACVKDIIIPTEGELDQFGILWIEALGAQHLIKQSRDEATDDRWSQNIEGCEIGFEATMIAKSIGTASGSHFAMKQGGSNHSKGDWKAERWLDTGIRADGTIQLQYEGPHPSNHDFTLPDKCQFIKKLSKGLEGNWIGLKWCQQILKAGGSPSNGGVRWRMWANVDIAEDGKPDNTKWQLVYDFTDGVDGVKVIEPQDFVMKGTMDAEVRRSDTKNHEVFAGGLHVRNLKK